MGGGGHRPSFRGHSTCRRGLPRRAGTDAPHRRLLRCAVMCCAVLSCPVLSCPVQLCSVLVCSLLCEGVFWSVFVLFCVLLCSVPKLLFSSSLIRSCNSRVGCYRAIRRLRSVVCRVDQHVTSKMGNMSGVSAWAWANVRCVRHRSAATGACLYNRYREAASCAKDTTRRASTCAISRIG